MALGSSSFGTIIQSSQDNPFVNNTNTENNVPILSLTNIPVETAGSVAWGGFDICELSTTTEVDYSAYTSAPVETAGSVASAPAGSFASTTGSSGTVTVATASVSSAPSSTCSCSYSC